MSRTGAAKKNGNNVHVTMEIVAELGELKKISWNYFDQTDVYSSSDGKESFCNEQDPRLIPELGRFPGAGHDNPYQYSCLENSINRGAWRATVHGLAELDMTERLTLSLHFTSLNNYRIDFSLVYVIHSQT